MTREDIIKLAREAGLMSFKYPALIAEPDWEATERFAALVAAAEREACVKRAEVAMLGANHELTLRVISAIRARGQA